MRVPAALMGWLFVLLFVAVAGGVLLRWGGLGRGVVSLAGLALLVAAAGYAWQGSPGLAGAPATPREGAPHEPSLLAVIRPAMMRPSAADIGLLDRAERLHLQGLDDQAAAELSAALHAHPTDVDLWTGLGNALAGHADGALTPAARFAFAKALSIDSRAPAPAFLLGAGLAENGEAPAAAAIWRDMLAHAPPGADWAPLVKMLVARAEMSMQEGGNAQGEAAP